MGLDDTDQRDLERTTSKLTNLTNHLGPPVSELAAQVTTTCARLNPARPLLAALQRTCEPATLMRKLAAIAPNRCARPTGACIRTMQRLADATDAHTRARAAYAAMINAHVKPGACQDTLRPTPEELAAAPNYASSLRRQADALADRNGRDAAAASRDIVASAAAAMGANDPRPAPVIMDELRDRCGLPKYDDPQ